MSALADHLHALISRFTSIGRKDVEDIVQAVEGHLVPLLEVARTRLVADVEAIVAEVKVDEQALAKLVATEVAKLLSNAPADPAPVPVPEPVPVPAPVVPPAV
ncbi:hypothetical protein QMK19_03610 [Streptomyces sp. H10-C2]|uniref:hypothetical protein n=1 Tax=unclassified Streptomyces TaxID=2593676 RepID=UPI0024BA87E4|nr:MULTISPECIES: hypothetical protein [unclassified Streptomyces]MDJ0342274.1 hypothetical protein [Streptomyces sp. PH10-H1]MDJ0368788.1 hypothetical protein [Streptomyces sp. H10-C2]